MFQCYGTKTLLLNNVLFVLDVRSYGFLFRDNQMAPSRVCTEHSTVYLIGGVWFQRDLTRFPAIACRPRCYVDLASLTRLREVAALSIPSTPPGICMACRCVHQDGFTPE